MSAGRLTYSDIKSDFLDNTGNPGSSDTTLVAFFDRHLVVRYQDLQAEFSNYTTEKPPQTASTVNAQQFYSYPRGVTNIESINIDIGDQNIPLQIVNSQKIWDELNAVNVNSWPAYFFPRKDDFGLWPIPDAVYTINLNSHHGDRSLTTADFATGTVTVANNDATITHSATGFTALMVGRWFRVDQDGYWYRIASFTDTSNMELETVFEGTGTSGLSFRIGESPEIPVEAHVLLSYGTTSDYFRGPRGDKTKANDWESMYLKGREEVQERYAQRSDSRLIQRGMGRRNRSRVNPLWAKTITI